MRNHFVLLFFLLGFLYRSEMTQAESCRSYLENLQLILNGEIRFEGNRPLNFFDGVEESFYKLPKGSIIRVLNIRDKIGSNGILESGPTILKRNSEFENRLIGYSFALPGVPGFLIFEHLIEMGKNWPISQSL